MNKVIIRNEIHKNLNMLKELRSEARWSEAEGGNNIYLLINELNLPMFDSYGIKHLIPTDEFHNKEYGAYTRFTDNMSLAEFINDLKTAEITINGENTGKKVQDYLPDIAITKEEFKKIKDNPYSSIIVSPNYINQTMSIKTALDLGFSKGQMAFHDGTGKVVDHKKGYFGNIKPPTKIVELYEDQGDKKVMTEKSYSEVKEFYSPETGYVYDYEEE